MALLGLRDIHLGYGGDPVLDGLELHLEAGERVGLVGRNGAGKSSLLKVLAGHVTPDEGHIHKQQNLTVALLSQDVSQDLAGRVYDTVTEGLGARGKALAVYHELSHKLSDGHHDEGLVERLGAAQGELEALGGWDIYQQVEQILSRMKLDPDGEVQTFSAGLKRRVLLAKALVDKPDLLLLDEPTNHLDITAIEWLEQFLVDEGLSLVFVTHDRVFLQKLATRIVEVDRGKVFDWRCDYKTFLERKQQTLDAEEKEWARFDKKLAQEEVWIRRGVRERRKRNMGRVRDLYKMRDERRQRRERVGQVQIEVQESERSGRQVAKVNNISFAYGDTPIVTDFSTVIQRGDRIGLIGPNGAGKTTLLRLILGELKPDKGTVKHGTNMQVAYFDQLHAQIDGRLTGVENVVQDGDTVTINGKNRHIFGYLEDFLFTPDRAKAPAWTLSGGERNRLLLAKLFTQPSNVLVLDEPTNDLDAETLDLLEELLTQYEGTVLLVSHDRAFLNNVVTGVFAFEGGGVVKEYVGGYDDWIRQRGPLPAAKKTAPAPDKPVRPAPERTARPKRLSYKDQRELEALPEKIDALETEQARLHEKFADPAFIKQSGVEMPKLKARLAEVETELEGLYARWEDLETLRSE